MSIAAKDPLRNFELVTPDKGELVDKIEKLCREWLPAYMLFAIGEKAKAQGMLFRDDFFIHMQKHMIRLAGGLDDISVARASRIVAERAEILLREVTTDNAVAVIYVILYSILKAVDEGVIKDVSSQPVLYAVLMINESEDMGFATTFNTRWVKQKAGEMFSTCYYKQWYA